MVILDILLVAVENRNVVDNDDETYRIVQQQEQQGKKNSGQDDCCGLSYRTDVTVKRSRRIHDDDSIAVAEQVMDKFYRSIFTQKDLADHGTIYNGSCNAPYKTYLRTFIMIGESVL